MKIIILAAGLGRRLNKNIPKALVKLINGNTILDYQLEYINKITSIDNVVIVTGFKHKKIKEMYPSIHQVINYEYETTNTAKSLLKGISQIDEEIIFINGDVVFHPDILNKIILNKSHNMISVNNSKVGEEEIKYILDGNNNIKNLSKSVINSLGEAVGINYITREFIDRFKGYLEKCNDQDYFEKAIENAISEGAIFKPLNIGDLFCCEIDFLEDLEVANNYIKNLNV